MATRRNFTQEYKDQAVSHLRAGGHGLDEVVALPAQGVEAGVQPDPTRPLGRVSISPR